LNQADFKKLISGQKKGLIAALLRLVLRVSAVGYFLFIGLRNLLYSRGLLKTHRVNAVIFSVGNITVGGTGKTPLVIWLCNQLTQNSKLKAKSYNCAILTRGYKASQDPKLENQNYTDEPAILAGSCAGAKVIVNPDRVAGAVEAVSRFGVKVLIMDDGFQHRRLARNLDIVTIDAMQPFGYGRLFPAGLLREPVSALKRADAVVITRCDQIGEVKLAKIEERLKQVNSNMVIARSVHAPILAKSKDNKEINLKELKDKKVFAFCGIGNPDAFFNTVKKTCSDLVGSKVYNDHHHYTVGCLAGIYAQAKHLKAGLILTTQKDWTKITLPEALKKDTSLAYLAIEMKFVVGEDKLTALIKDALAGKIGGK